MQIKKLLIIIFCLIAYTQMKDETALAFAFYFGDIGPPGENEVHIGKTALVMPLGRIMLARNNQDYCAIKFTKYWSENESTESSVFVESGADEYATYESYYRRDQSSNASDKSWKIKTAKLSLPKLRGLWRLAFSFADEEISCGNIIIRWYGKGAVTFYKSDPRYGAASLEFAPTPWTDISQVTFSDSRIKWYKYDDERERINISIENIWD